MTCMSKILYMLVLQLLRINFNMEYPKL